MAHKMKGKSIIAVCLDFNPDEILRCNSRNTLSTVTTAIYYEIGIDIPSVITLIQH